MSVTVADVLLHARDRHPAFDKRTTPDVVLFRYLTRYQQELFSRIAQIKRSAVQSVFEVEVPAEDDFADGDYIPEHILVHGGDVVFEDTNRKREPLELVTFGQRLEDRRYGAYIQGRNIRLLGSFSDWDGVERVDVYYFPRGEDLADRSSEFELPGQPLSCLNAAAVWLLGSRAPADTNPPIDVRGLEAERTQAEEDYLDQVTGRRIAVVGSVKEVW